jgi:dolichol-phosphate mannosyltransferase
MNSYTKYSIVVPFYNEAANVTPLYVRLTDVMEQLDGPYEMVFVDDGSSDDTLNTLYQICENDSRVG